MCFCGRRGFNTKRKGPRPSLRVLASPRMTFIPNASRPLLPSCYHTGKRSVRPGLAHRRLGNKTNVKKDEADSGAGPTPDILPPRQSHTPLPSVHTSLPPNSQRGSFLLLLVALPSSPFRLGRSALTSERPPWPFPWALCRARRQLVPTKHPEQALRPHVKPAGHCPSHLSKGHDGHQGQGCTWISRASAHCV